MSFVQRSFSDFIHTCKVCLVEIKANENSDFQSYRYVLAYSDMKNHTFVSTNGTECIQINITSKDIFAENRAENMFGIRTKTHTLRFHLNETFDSVETERLYERAFVQTTQKAHDNIDALDYTTFNRLIKKEPSLIAQTVEGWLYVTNGHFLVRLQRDNLDEKTEEILSGRFSGIPKEIAKEIGRGLTQHKLKELWEQFVNEMNCINPTDLLIQSDKQFFRVFETNNMLALDERYFKLVNKAWRDNQFDGFSIRHWRIKSEGVGFQFGNLFVMPVKSNVISRWTSRLSSNNKEVQTNMEAKNSNAS